MIELKKATPGLKFRAFAFDVKTKGDDGVIEGYGAVFGNIDEYRDVIEKGAFSRTLEERKEKDRPFPMLWQHLTSEPIGVWTKLAEDKTGLYVQGRLLKDKIAKASEVWAMIQERIVTGLSIGYRTVAARFDEKNLIRYLTDLDLEEISAVVFPANDEARVEAFKVAVREGNFPSIKDFEARLRDEDGFSRSQAKHIASRGYADFLRRDAGGLLEAGPDAGDVLAEAKRAISTFKLPKFAKG